MVADALSCKPHGILASLALEDWKRSATVVGFNLQYYEGDNITLVYNVTTILSLLQHAKETQWQDVEFREIWNKLYNGKQLDGWSTNHEVFMYYKGRLAISNSLDL